MCLLELSPASLLTWPCISLHKAQGFFFSLLHSGRNFHSALLTADEVNGFITVLLKEYSQSSFYPCNKTFHHHPHSRMAVQYADEHPFLSVFLEWQPLILNQGRQSASVGTDAR